LWNLLKKNIIVMFLMRAFICSWNFFLIVIILIMCNLLISLEEKLSFTINFCNKKMSFIVKYEKCCLQLEN
jgi:hypothetical protein